MPVIFYDLFCRKLILASVLCLFFMVVEIVGGVLANSLVPILRNILGRNLPKKTWLIVNYRFLS
jgi:hypothetical protein